MERQLFGSVQQHVLAVEEAAAAAAVGWVSREDHQLQRIVTVATRMASGQQARGERSSVVAGHAVTGMQELEEPWTHLRRL